jgi:glycine/D-amino acid oxidase-like deaminating enzyme
MSPPVADVRSSEKLPASADVVIIGGGMAGVAAAFALAKKGVSVAIVEKGRIAAEQSSRNWGWCRQQNRDVREIPLIKRSLEMWGELDREVGADLGFRRTGLVYVTTKPEDLAQWEAWCNAARPFQVHSHMLSPAEAKEKTPGSVGHWIGGVHSPTDGRAEPMLAVPAIAEAARKLGATIHQDCAVRGLETSAGRVSGVITEHGVIRAQAVLCAGGAWAGMFCRRHGISLPQAGVRSTSFYTDATPEVVSGGLSTPNFTMRRRLDGGYTIGLSGRGRLEVSPQGLRYAREFWPMYKKRRANLKISVGSSFFKGPETFARWAFDKPTPFEAFRVYDPEPDPDLVEEGIAGLATLYPSVGRRRVMQSWGGLIDCTPDAIPVISEVDSLPGFFLSTGYSGHGFGIGPAAGQLAADLIRGDRPIVDPQPFRYSRMIDGTSFASGPGMI